jgi:EAL domain-containing protein (putative c-di-GMP-specific phosphodiesterase class I)
LKTVAEFVETDDIRQKLVEIGVDFGQGYSLGKPQPIQEVISGISRASKSA